MSKYTTQLRYICEQKAGLLSSDDNYIETINNSYDKIIHPDTPLYDPDYAPILFKKIIRHYYFDEIAHETAGQFIMRLNTKLDEILPYYNQLYRSAALEFNPFYDVDYTRIGQKEDNNTDNRTRTDNLTSQRTDNLTSQRTDALANSASSSQTDLFSDTPEGSLSGVDNSNYLTNARKITSSASGTNTGTQTYKDTGTQTNSNTGTQTNSAAIHNLNEYYERVVGKMNTTSYSEMLIKFRETFLNIDMMLINELHGLFMQVY